MYNRNRRFKYRGEKELKSQLDSFDIPVVPAIIVYFYRQRKNEPLHAASVELRVGQQKKATLEPVHTLGWTGAHVKNYITGAIIQFNRQYEVSINDVAATVELNPGLCPLFPCPLKTDADQS